MTASPDDPGLEKPYQYVKGEFIGKGNRTFAKLNFLKADVVLSTTPGLQVYQWNRSKDVKWYAHALHMANDPTTYRMFGLDYYDALLLSGKYQMQQARSLEALRQLPAKELQLVGLLYLDNMLARLSDVGPIQEHPTTILIAPSWGKSSLFGHYEGKIIEAALSTGYHVIVRPHPQSFVSEQEMIERLQKAYPESDRLEWNRDNDNFEVLRRSDIMVSDFSGVIFDFCLVFQKPVIYADTSFDKGPYDACWLEDELWTFKTLLKVGRQLTPDNLDHFKQIVDEMLTNEQYKEALEEARNQAWAHRGESASRIADYLIEKEKELTREASPAEE